MGSYTKSNLDLLGGGGSVGAFLTIMEKQEKPVAPYIYLCSEFTSKLKCHSSRTPKNGHFWDLWPLENAKDPKAPIIIDVGSTKLLESNQEKSKIFSKNTVGCSKYQKSKIVKRP